MLKNIIKLLDKDRKDAHVIASHYYVKMNKATNDEDRELYHRIADNSRRHLRECVKSIAYLKELERGGQSNGNN